MELILISESKLKIMLNESDMKEYKIGEEADCADGSTRKAIRSLLDRVRDQIGFDTAGEEIFVQLYTSKRGGCELFVTKCHLESEENGAEKSIKMQQNCSETTEIRQNSEKKKEKRSGGYSQNRLPAEKKETGIALPRTFGRMAYSFPSAEVLCRVCRVLSGRGKRLCGSAFSDDCGRYYLLLENVGNAVYNRLDGLSFLSEFGERENPDALLAYIAEHGKVLCAEHAVSLLGTL